MENKIKCSFDFDNTLDRDPIKKYAKELIERGIDVYITTSRFTAEEYSKQYFCKVYDINKDLFEIAKELGISNEKIHFTNMANKYHYILEHDFVWHLDDDWIELININENTKTIAISSLSTNWKDECEKLLKRFRGN